jgi:hypothetical protein
MKETPMDNQFVHAAAFLRRMDEECGNPFSRATIMEPWISDFVDVPTIHGHATKQISQLIKKVRREGRSKARLLIGDAANGKSHILARTKNRFADQAFFCFVEPLTGDGDNIFRHILSNTVRDLLRAVPGSPHPQFHRVWRDFFLGAARDRTEHKLNFEAWIDGRKYDFMCQIDGQLKATGKSIEPALIGVLYDYVKNYSTDTRVRLVVENWLGAKHLTEEELALVDFPFRSPINTEDKAKDMIKALGLVTSFSRPVFLCFDQVEAYILNDRAFRAFMKAVEYIVEYTHNFAMVTAALLTFDEKLRTTGLTPSTWDRFNFTSKPIIVHPLTPAEGEKLIEARLAVEVCDLGICALRPLFPFCTEDLDAILTPPGAKSRTHKQARYILEDAESVFDRIAAKRPSPRAIREYFNEDIPLHKPLPESPPPVDWPRRGDVERYLTIAMEKEFARINENSHEVVTDDERNRKIVLDLLFKAMNDGTRSKFLDVAELTVFQGQTPTGCDFTVTVRRDDGQSHCVGVLFCDETRANVIQGLINKATKLLQSKSVDEFVYVRDSRATLTKKSQSVLEAFEERFSKGSERVIFSNVDPGTLNHLRAMSRLFEIAGSGELVLHNAELKREYRITHKDICDYLIKNNCLLVNGIILTIVTGKDQCRVAGSNGDATTR